MSAPRVSVVIAAFNAANLIHVAIGSIAALHLPDVGVEVIVVDDGSSDGTADVARKLLEKLTIDVDVIVQSNSGPSCARNLGWRRARGDWIQFLDADDEIAPNKLNLQLAAANAAGPEVACLYSPWEMTISGLRRYFDPRLGDDCVADLLRGENFIPFGSALVARCWLEEVDGFDPGLRLIEDVDLQLRMAMAGGQYVRCETASVFTYNVVPGSLSRSDPVRFHQACIRNARSVIRHWGGAAGVTGSRREVLVGVYEGALRALCAESPAVFNDVLAELRTWAPDFQPAGVRERAISRVVGVRGAFLLVRATRRLRGLSV